jgi:serine/threonine protein phosphatase PrpC
LQLPICFIETIDFWCVCDGMSGKAAKKATVERVAELAMKLGGKHLAD